MAKEEIINEQYKVVSLTQREIVDLISLLSAQLVNIAAPGQQNGACPDINIWDRGQIKYRMSFVLERYDSYI